MIDPLDFVAIKRVYGTEVEIYERGGIIKSWSDPRNAGGFTDSNLILNYSHEGTNVRAKHMIGSGEYLLFVVQKFKAKWNRLYLIDAQGKEYLINNFDFDYSNGHYYYEFHPQWRYNPNMITFFWD